MPTASKTSKSKSQTTNVRRGRPSSKFGEVPAADGATAAAGENSPAYLYVYCAVRGAAPSRAVSKLPTLPDGAPPRVLALTDDISLIVADVPAELYAADRIEAQLGDIDWVGRCGSAHHAVAEALAGRYTVAPLRPFTLFSSEARARETFAGLADRINAALDHVKGKAEWVVRVGKPDPTRLAAQARSTPADELTSGAAFLARKAADKRHLAESVMRVREHSSVLFRAIAALADAADRRPADAATGLLLDAAFLVPSRQTASFKRVLESKARSLLDAGCRVSVTGPWPPYSFVSLDAGQVRE